MAPGLASPGVGRPISARWREWQSDRRNETYADRWGATYGAGRPLSTPRVRCQSPTPGSVRACFERFDRNGSGRLDCGELRTALQHLGYDPRRAEAAELLAAYDADGSGLMEIDEFARLSHRVRRASQGVQPPHPSRGGSRDRRDSRDDSQDYSQGYSRGHSGGHSGEPSAAYCHLPPEPYLPPPRPHAATEPVGELQVQRW